MGSCNIDCVVENVQKPGNKIKVANLLVDLDNPAT